MSVRPNTQPIIPDRLYPIQTAMDHLGWGWTTLKQARAKGLKTHRFGSRVYVLGSELIRIITKFGRES